MIDPDNPKGVLFGPYVSNLASVTADESDGTIAAIRLNLNSIPDIPLTELEIVIDENSSRGGALDQTLIKFVGPTDPACRPSPADYVQQLPEYLDPWNMIARLRLWSSITNTSDKSMTNAISDLFPSRPAAPLSPKDTEIRQPMSMTGCEAHE